MDPAGVHLLGLLAGGPRSVDEESPMANSRKPRGQSPQAAAGSSLESWESLRIHFSAQVLDKFAHFYNSIESDAGGVHTIPFNDLKSAAKQFLNLPAQGVLDEMHRR